MTDPITWTNTRVRLGDLAPWPRNPRRIKGREAERLAESFDTFGQVETLALGPPDEHGKAPVYNGHQRLAVLLKQHGKGFEVDARQASRPLTEKEREKLTVYLHRGAAGEWDVSALGEWDAADLLEWGFEAQELGIAPPKSDVDAEPQIDRAEELRQKWGVEPGDLWALGEHRLICGDCTDPATVARVMQGERAAAVVTDPPYGINVVANSPRLRELGYSQFDGDESTDTAKAAFALWGSMGVQVWFGANYYAEVLPPSRCWVVWDKDHHGMDFADAELAWSNADMPVRVFRHAWSGADRDSEKGQARLHANQKPVALAEWCIRTIASDAAIVADPFCGAGFVLLACEQLGRRCRAVEISPAYVSVALQRWADATGRVPELIEP